MTKRAFRPRSAWTSTATNCSPPRPARPSGWISPVVLHGGRVAGVWEQRNGDVEVTAFGDVPAGPLKDEIDRVAPLLS
ncbi:hypothetical protein [Actinomadura monticuli]|uniref:Winged helix DNA-binding domain-containing protein n=1 Tax=Actinomadura monticuli TaxID=3097367 RepID=A0ABV4QMG5_9ACTN